MKKLLFSIALTAVAAFSAKTAVAQEVTAGPKIEFKKDTHDYGNIKYGADGSCSFEFKNTGNAPLIISNAKGSCGCTVPAWSREPLMPGQSASIRVKYNTANPGPINKTVTVESNARENRVVLRIKGKVLN